MNRLAESIHYEIYSEYELVYLKIKSCNKLVKIGDFYGDVDKVIISQKERYCVMSGNGIIVYKLKEPYIEYGYEKISDQWRELFRSGNTWIIDINLKGEDILVVTKENGSIKKININKLFKNGENQVKV